MSASVDPIEEIEIPKPKDDAANIQDAEEITDFKDIASYNWMDKTDPAILVPGRRYWICPPAECHILANS